MNQLFECGKCRHSFIAKPNYNDDPQTRNCPKCKKAKGEILYHGAKSGLHVISDNLGEGVKGVLNPANGKTYDSKSEYRKALKSAGCVEMGTDAKVTERKELRGNYDVSKELSQAIDQTGFMDKIKGKK